MDVRRVQVPNVRAERGVTWDGGVDVGWEVFEGLRVREGVPEGGEVDEEDGGV